MSSTSSFILSSFLFGSVTSSKISNNGPLANFSAQITKSNHCVQHFTVFSVSVFLISPITTQLLFSVCITVLVCISYFLCAAYGLQISSSGSPRVIEICNFTQIFGSQQIIDPVIWSLTSGQTRSTWMTFFNKIIHN